jgi:hypothetical protein
VVKSIIILGGVERVERATILFKRGEKVRYGVMEDFSVGIFYKIARVIYYQIANFTWIMWGSDLHILSQNHSKKDVEGKLAVTDFVSVKK